MSELELKPSSRALEFTVRMSAWYRCVHSGISKAQQDSMTSGCGRKGWNYVYALTLSTSRHTRHCWPLQISECIFPLSCHFTILISDIETVRIYPAWIFMVLFFPPFSPLKPSFKSQQHPITFLIKPLQWPHIPYTVLPSWYPKQSGI